MNRIKKSLSVTFILLAMTSSAFAAAECNSGVQSALDQQQSSFVSAQQSLASQGFSKRPGSFAQTTCLDTLMQTSGMDILFKPPSLDTILSMVKNLACQQASQIFDSLTGGALSKASSLMSGDLSSGLNIGGQMTNFVGSSSISTGTVDTSSVDTSLQRLFK